MESILRPSPAGLEPGEITLLLRRLAEGDRAVDQLLFARIYDELRVLASRRLSGERRSHTLQPTALVNEVYLRMSGVPMDGVRDRVHFMALAAQAMRRILADYGRSRGAAKRSAFSNAVSIQPWHESVSTPEMVSELDEALSRFAEIDPESARVVEMHYFGGLTYDEMATILNCAPRTVKRKWQKARAWLYAELREK